MKKRGTSQMDKNKMSYYTYGNHDDIVGTKVDQLFGSLDDAVESVEDAYLKGSNDNDFEIIYEIRPVMILKKVISVGKEVIKDSERW